MKLPFKSESSEAIGRRSQSRRFSVQSARPTLSRKYGYAVIYAAGLSKQRYD